MQRNHIRREMAGIGALHQRHARIVAQLPGKLTVADVDGVHMGCAVLEANVGKATCRSADIHADLAVQIGRKGLDGLFQLQAATAGIGVCAALEMQLVLGLDDLGGFVDASRAHIYLARHDAGLGLAAAFAQAALHQRHVSAQFFTHESGSFRAFQSECAEPSALR